MKIDNAESTADKLRAMRLSAMAEELEKLRLGRLAEPMSGEELLAAVVDAEWEKRATSRLSRLVTQAGLPFPLALIEDIRNVPVRQVDMGMLKQLGCCDYIRDGHNVTIQGASGSGKTYIASALGVAACQKGYSVRYSRMPDLLNELVIAAGAEQTVRDMCRYDLLIIDDWLVQPVSDRQIYPLLDLLEYRCAGRECRPVIFSTPYSREAMAERLKSFACGPIGADLIMDRISFNTYTVTIKSTESMRKYLSDLSRRGEGGAGDSSPAEH